MGLDDTTRVSVIIPVYNEELHVQEVLDRLLAMKPLEKAEIEIIIVDDGSTDNTRNILDSYKGKGALQIHFQAKNFGKGAAIREGIKHATGEIILIQDADLEYSIDDYPALLAPLLRGDADAVYGSRFLGTMSGMQLPNFIFNKFICWMVNFLFGSEITDEATAYKVVRAPLMKSLGLRSDRFEICPEITAKLLKRGVKIHEVPIQYKARKKSEGKKITWVDAIDAIYTLLKFRLFD